MKKGMRIEVACLTILSMSFLSIAIGFVGYLQYYRNVFDNYSKYAAMTVGMASDIWEEYSLGDMLLQGEMTPEYEEARLKLNMIKNNADIKYLYGVYFEDINDIHSVCYVINAKSDEELSTGEPYSDIYSYMGEKCEEDAFSEQVLYQFQNSIINRDPQIQFEESETKEYGHLGTWYRVVYDSQGNPVAILGVDIEVNKIRRDMTTYLASIAFISIIFTIAAIVLFILNIQRFVVNPVAKIARNVDDFVALMEESVEPEKLIYEKPAVRSNDEIRLLSDGVEEMADGVRSYMMNLRGITAEKERIGAELELATKIQANMLPNIFPAFPDRDEFDIYATMTPAKEVGGDFYDFFLIDEDHLGFLIADVSGKGVPAALFMMMSKILISNYAMSGISPKEVLEKTNEQICKNNEEDMFVTVWFGILTISTGHIVASNAGHEYPMIRKAGGAFELFKDPHSFLIGGMEGMVYQEYEMTLGHGDTLFLYTDGLPEAADADTQRFELQRVLDVLNQDADAEPEQILHNMKAAVDTFVGEASQFDDLTMVALKLR